MIGGREGESWRSEVRRRAKLKKTNIPRSVIRPLRLFSHSIYVAIGFGVRYERVV